MLFEQSPRGMPTLINRKFLISMQICEFFYTGFSFRRKQDRRECLDLQTFTVQRPAPPVSLENRPATEKPSHYPVALVPGQFQEYYRTYNAAELL